MLDTQTTFNWGKADAVARAELIRYRSEFDQRELLCFLDSEEILQLLHVPSVDLVSLINHLSPRIVADLLQLADIEESIKFLTSYKPHIEALLEIKKQGVLKNLTSKLTEESREKVINLIRDKSIERWKERGRGEKEFPQRYIATDGLLALLPNCARKCCNGDCRHNPNKYETCDVFIHVCKNHTRHLDCYAFFGPQSTHDDHSCEAI
jgi:hypothetical protein